MRTTRRSYGKTILERTRQHAHSVISAGTAEGERVAKQKCPVDRGDLLSTTYKADESPGRSSLGTGGPSQVSERYVSHHVYIEFGTSKMPAQSYYRPGIDAAKQHIKERIPRGVIRR